MKPDPTKSCGPYKPLSEEELSGWTKEVAVESKGVDHVGSGPAQRSLAQTSPGRELLQHARTGDLSRPATAAVSLSGSHNLPVQLYS